MRVRIEITHEGQSYSGEMDLHSSAVVRKMSSSPTRFEHSSTHAVRKPSAAIEFLYRKNFFKESHGLAEVWEELRKEGYNFSRPAILMALKAASYLTMTGKRGSYRFVQKFPPA